MSMFLHSRVVAGRDVDSAVEVNESGMAICFSVIQDTLDTGLFRDVLDSHFV
jgi:hypothetical protein